MELYTDNYYVKRIQEGDDACFACILDKYGTQIHTLIVRIVGNSEDAEELSQDVFMKVYKSIVSFKGTSRFSTWIYRIAYNTAISATRRRKQVYLTLEESQLTNVSDDELNDSMSSLEKSERLERLEHALELLSPDERALILMFYMQEKTIDDLVQITGLSNSNVKTKLHRIRKKLVVLLQEMEEKE
ncbi:MAG: RNA polymerase sigma factor [Lentimicrobiaceae bacterium]|jgi:RNA polymerase sigma-70 factor (ECF subfamily)|nr:RNA polymerase sigma factor [Lentimicrobiaceae bacterium]